MVGELTGCENFGSAYGIYDRHTYLANSSADASDLLAYWSNKDKVWRKLVKVARACSVCPHPALHLSDRSASLGILWLTGAHNCRLNLWMA